VCRQALPLSLRRLLRLLRLRERQGLTGRRMVQTGCLPLVEALPSRIQGNLFHLVGRQRI